MIVQDKMGWLGIEVSRTLLSRHLDFVTTARSDLPVCATVNARRCPPDPIGPTCIMREGLPREQGTLSHEVGATLRCHISRGVGWPARHTERPDDGRAVILMNAARKPGMESPYRAGGDNGICGAAPLTSPSLCRLIETSSRRFWIQIQ